MRSFLAMKRVSNLTTLRLNLEPLERTRIRDRKGFGELLLSVVEYADTQISVISR